MDRIAYILALIVGLILLFWGFRASESLSSDISRLFTGSPTDKAIWLIIGGVVAAGLGILGLFLSRK